MELHLPPWGRLAAFSLAVLALQACGSSSTSPDLDGDPDDPGSDPDPDPDPYSVIETFAGTGTAALGPDGEPPLETELYLPQDLTFGPDGLPYILDWNNHRVRVIEGGLMRTVIGTGELGDADAGAATEIGLNHPTHISFDPQGRLILSAWHNSKVLRMDMGTRYIEPICGNGQRFFSGDDGPAIDAILNLPCATVFDAAGQAYILDQANQRVRRVDLDGIITTVVGTGSVGFAGDGGPATDALLSLPFGQSAPPSSRITFDAAGNLYISDTRNNRIRKVDPSGIITTVAGNGVAGFSGDGGPATEAALYWPSDVAVDSAGNLYIADPFNSCVRKVNPSGIISTFAGQGGTSGFEGDGGAPHEALLNRPYGIAFDADDNLYIADTYNHRIRVIRK